MVDHDLEPIAGFLERLASMPTRAQRSANELSLAAPTLAPDVKAHLLSLYDGVPVDRTMRNTRGQVFDCVPLEGQPAARLFSTPPRPPAPDEPTEMMRALMAANAEVAPPCPPGFVPLPRPSLREASRFTDLHQYLTLGRSKRRPPVDDQGSPYAYVERLDTSHRYATAYQRVSNLGGQAGMNLWKPRLTTQNDMSLSQIWCSAGIAVGQTVQTVEAGWQVCPANFPNAGDNPVFFIYWTGDGYGPGDAYNNRDGKFYKQASEFLFGEPYVTTSMSGGPQYELEVSYQLTSGAWWLYVGGVAIGAYSASIFNGGPMSAGAEEVMFGGEIYGPNALPAMGSGARPDRGYGSAAYQRNIGYRDAAGHRLPASLQTFTSTPDAYGLSLGRPSAPEGEPWGTYFFFGGAGGT